jgi:hypothetical protein
VAGLEFAAERREKPAVVKRPPVGTCCHGEIDESLLVEAVVAASLRYGLYPERIEYVENDSPRYELYGHCAGLLAKRAAGDEA